MAYLQSDFDTIFAEVIKKDNIDFFDARIIDRYREVAGRINSPIDERYLISENNHDFRLYRILSREHLLGRTIEEINVIFFYHQQKSYQNPIANRPWNPSFLIPKTDFKKNVINYIPVFLFCTQNSQCPPDFITQ